MPEYECEGRFRVTADSEADAYSQFADSGVSAGALIGSVLLLNIDPFDSVDGEAL